MPAEAATADPSLRIGKFIPTAKLGSGASGEVWKAWDSVLNRWVALKVLPVEDSEESARFTREAETAATLSHPNIAAIYEAGHERGRHFLAMQFVDGVTLQKYPRGNRKLLVRILRDAARAVAAAHEQGIVHRDLKPANIAVGRRSEDPSHPHVYVLDFGLARQIRGAERLTASGIVVGTPAYMSPEQARGELVDGRTDVYALGATLYELLTNRPPFRGPNVYEVLRKVQESEPKSPRVYDSKIPRDLELVVLKALEKNPNRRYASAAELADDLDRYLEGDPVLANAPGVLYRLRKMLSKRKSVAIAVASLILAALLGGWLTLGTAEARHYRLMTSGMHLWDLVRLAVNGGDSEDIRKKAKAAREVFEQAIQARNESPAHVMKAKCLVLEGLDTEAQRALEKAHEVDPEDSEARMELAKMLLQKYQASRTQASSFTGRAGGFTWNYSVSRPPETTLERHWRERAEKLLAGRVVTRSKEGLLKGLLLMGKGDFAAAASELSIYSKAEAWDSQALMLEALCHLYMGHVEAALSAFNRLLMRFPNAGGFGWRGFAKFHRGLFDDAIEDCTKAIELNPNMAGGYFNRGLAESGKGLYDRAIADFTKVLELDSSNVAAYLNRGNAQIAKELPDEAIADYAKAIEMSPSFAAAYEGRGLANHRKGLYDRAILDHLKAIELDATRASAFECLGYSKHAQRFYGEAIEAYNKAIELDPINATSAYNRRGITKFELGLLDEAIADFTKSIQLDSKYLKAYFNRGQANNRKGLHDAAIGDFNKAIELDPNQAAAYCSRGIAKGAKGLHDEAITDYTKAIELDPKNADAYTNRGLVRCDVKRLYDGAVADFTKVLELNPKDAEAYFNRGNAHWYQGRMDGAIEDYTKAIELEPKHVRAYNNRANAKDDKGQHDEAIADYTKALELDPGFAAAYCNRGTLLVGVKRLYEDAIADFTKAISLDPKFQEAYHKRGYCYSALGRYNEAIADYTNSIALNPNDAESYLNRGNAKATKGLLDEAIEDCKKALEVSPADWTHRPRIEERIAEFEALAANPQLKATAELFEKSNRLHGQGKYAEAIEGFRKIATEQPKTQAGLSSAYNVACGYALLGKKSEALDWLEKAAEMGWKNVDHIKRDTDLDSLRSEERFKRLLKKLEQK